MAVRLHMKLGVVAEHDRLADSPDTLVVVEPSVGSVARSKGHLYLLVTSRISSRHALEATRLAAETIRNEYYYDESAGIRVCLQKAIATANKRLAHQADRLGPQVARRQRADRRSASRSSAAARCTSRPSARPRPTSSARPACRRCPTRTASAACRRARSSPTSGAARSRSATRSCLVSPNVIAKLGADELKDAMLTLHPQSAMEHLHHRFVAADGSGSDGAIAFEATEVVVDQPGPDARAGPARRAAGRRAGPLADPARRQRPGGRRRRSAPRPATPGPRPAARFERVVGRVQDLMPRRKPAYRRVTPLASRRETQRRAAAGDPRALVVVVGGLGLGVYAFGGDTASRRRSARSTPARRRSTRRRADLAKVSGSGHRPRRPTTRTRRSSC